MLSLSQHLSIAFSPAHILQEGCRKAWAPGDGDAAKAKAAQEALATRIRLNGEAAQGKYKSGGK